MLSSDSGLDPFFSECEQAMRNAVAQFVQEVSETIYGVVVVAASGYPSAFLSIATIEGLQRVIETAAARDAETMKALEAHPDLLRIAEHQLALSDRLYYELSACEWPYSPYLPHCFNKANRELYQLQNERDGEFTDEIERRFEEMVLRLRKDKVFTGPSWASDVFSGLQFADFDHTDVMQRVSQRVNSAAWHQRFAQLCSRGVRNTRE